MGLLSKIISKFKKQSSSPQSSSLMSYNPSSPSKQEKVTITNVPAKKLSPVKAIDFSSKKKGGGGSIVVRGEEGGDAEILSTSFSPEITKKQVEQRGYRIKPSTASTSSSPQNQNSLAPKMNGIVPNSQAKPTFGSTIKSIGNLGLIGEQGINSYFNNIFSPYERTTIPKVYDRRFYSSGTSIGYNNQILSNLGSNLDYGTYQAQITAGEINLGTPISLAGLPNSLKAQKLASNYQSKLNLESPRSAIEAQTMTEQYNFKLNKEYSDVLSKSIIPIKTNKVRSFTLGSLAVGSSFTPIGIATLSTIGTYQGLETYGSKFVLGNKNIGLKELGIATGKIAVGSYGLYAGYNQYYSGWQKQINEDLANQPLRYTGREINGGNNAKTILYQGTKSTGSGKELTYGRIDIVGNQATIIKAQSRTTTQLFNPRTNVWDTSRSGSGGIFFVSKPSPTTLEFNNNFAIAGKGTSSEVGGYEAIAKGVTYKASKNEITLEKGEYFGFATPSEGGIYKGVSGKIKYRTGNAQGFNGYKADLGSYGAIRSADNMGLDFGGGSFKSVLKSSSKSPSTAISKSISESIINQASQKSLVTAKTNGLPSSISSSSSLVSINSNKRRGQNLQLQTKQFTSLVNPISDNTFKTSTQTRQKVRISSASIQGSRFIQKTQDLNLAIPAVSIKTTTQTKQKQSPRVGFSPINVPTSGYYSLSPPKGFGFKFPNFDFGNADSTTRKIKGGKSIFGYNPSYSALVFNIKGKAKSYGKFETGFNFRPISFSKRRKRKK